jgi:hypothetical protein
MRPGGNRNWPATGPARPGGLVPLRWMLKSNQKGARMLSAELIQLVSDHSQVIAERAVKNMRRMRSKTQPLEGDSWSPARLRDTARELLENMGALLVSGDSEIAERYERLGRARFEDGVPLHELVYAWQVIKAAMMHYVYEHEGQSTPLDLYAKLELQRAADHVFDAMIRFAIRGYERAMREDPAGFGSSRRVPEAQPRFSGQLPF